MTQNNELLERLSTVIPSWRNDVKTPETPTFATVRYRMANQTLLQDAELVEQLRAMLKALSDECLAIADELQTMPTPHPKASWDEMKALARQLDPYHVVNKKNGWPRGWGDFARSRGYEYSTEHKCWLKPITKT